jgi:hypothetical protein
MMQPPPSIERASKFLAITVLVVPRSIPIVFCLRSDIGRPELWDLTLVRSMGREWPLGNNQAT